MRAVRHSGSARMVLVIGDRADIAETIGRIVGVDAVYPDRDPAEKLAIVHAEQKPAPTIMVGDGVDDAPRSRPVLCGGPGRSGSTRGAQVSGSRIPPELQIGADAKHT
jgi:hypothetical protein